MVPVDDKICGRVFRHHAARAFVDLVFTGGRRGHCCCSRGMRLKLRNRCSRAVMALKDAMFLVNSAEQPRFPADALRWSDEQIPAGPKRIMECLHDPVLEVVVHIDQHVAAGDQIDLGKRRVSDQIVFGKHAHIADGVDRNVVLPVLRKPVL